MAILELRLPKYNVTLPISKIKVEYKPFTVRESKILLLAQEENNLESIMQSVDQIISNCTFGKHSVESLNKIDAEFLFVQLRNKSMGEGVEIRAICKECKHKTPMTMNLDEVKVINIPTKILPFKILENVWITLKYPTMKDALLLDDSDSNAAIAMSLNTIIEGESIKLASDYTMAERVEFVESLTDLQVASLKPFFDNFPELVLDLEYTCKCGFKNDIHVEGIENFFV